MKRTCFVGLLLLLVGCGGAIADSSDSDTGSEQRDTSGAGGAKGDASADADTNAGEQADTPPLGSLPFIAGPSDFSLSTSGAVASFTKTADATNSVDGAPSTLLQGPEGTPEGSCAGVNVKRAIDPSYRGKRLRLRIKVKKVLPTPYGAKAYLSASAPTGDWVSTLKTFRSLTDTTDWQDIALVLDIPPSFTTLNFGANFCGSGQLWMGAVTIDEVTTTVPVTWPLSSGKVSP